MAKNITKKGVAKATENGVQGICHAGIGADAPLANKAIGVQDACNTIEEALQNGNGGLAPSGETQHAASLHGVSVICRVVQHGVIIGRGCYRRGVTLSLPVETARALEACGKVKILGV